MTISEPGMTPVSIALCSDDRYFPGLLVTVTSIIVHTAVDQPLEFFVLDTGIGDRHWRELERVVRRYSAVCTLRRIPLDLSRFGGYPRLDGSLGAYARILLPDLVDRDRVIYFDVDMLVLKDVRTLWDTPFDGKSTVAVREYQWTLAEGCPWLAPTDPERLLPYVNSGLLYLNLVAWRANEWHHRCMEFAARYPERCTSYDQTAINYVMRGDIKLLDATWNRFCDGALSLEECAAPSGINIHITHGKPWLRFKYLDGCLVWYAFHDLFVPGPPAVLRYGILWKRTKFANRLAVIRLLIEGCLIKSRWTWRMCAALLKATGRFHEYNLMADAWRQKLDARRNRERLSQPET